MIPRVVWQDIHLTKLSRDGSHCNGPLLGEKEHRNVTISVQSEIYSTFESTYSYSPEPRE